MISIVVTGSAAEGKTTVATLVKNSLAAAGFVVELEDLEPDTHPSDHSQRLAALMQRDPHIKVMTKMTSKGELR